ncbi:hypothetical protein [Comamonas endophytica]|uniref:Uncharacterized protein n=1 Tax=Comamonas endophytica TaxID=2949090 RepID=A0ABY6GEV8_9BURK|nr:MULTISPECIES: hypothetical protein [unclassified Acidovorax]MCD2512598.1 hypothetical protein [Acidovorax sp. D4N7]UYG53042.1 hypothetical protein M9799_07450 [Acidovorax sp. 5MLIR]
MNSAPLGASAHRSRWLPSSESLLGLYVTLAAAAIAIVVGLLVPQVIPLGFLQEDGFVERSTIWVYAVAFVCVLAWHGREAPLDAVSAALLLLAMALREMDLHKALFDISILKSRFYIDAPLWQIAVALAILLPIVAAGAWLAKRHLRRWLAPLSRWNAPMVTVAMLIAALVFAKIADRTPASLEEWGVHHYVPQTLLHVLLSLEEILEWMLPALAIVAALQLRRLREGRTR